MRFPLRCGGGLADLVRFRPGKFDHLGPLLGLAREKLGEIGGRAGQRRATQLGNLSSALRLFVLDFYRNQLSRGKEERDGTHETMGYPAPALS